MENEPIETDKYGNGIFWFSLLLRPPACYRSDDRNLQPTLIDLIDSIG